MFNIRNKLIQITQGGTFQLPTGTGYLDYLDIDVKEAGALPWSPELGRDKLLEIKYFISFSRILRHNVHFGHTGELSQLENIILDILSQLQTLYKDHKV